jgi:hypothetical protein
MSKEFNPGNFKITKNEDIYNGPHSEIDSVTLSSGEHSVNLLRKKFRGYSIEFMDGPKWHTVLKERGYPVFPTLRYDKKNEVEYVTDLRRGGKHRVIDFCGHKENFEKVYISNIKELEAEVEKLINKSSADGLVINESNIFFDIETGTGVATVLLGDLRELGLGDVDEDYVPSKKEIFDNNQAILKEHMDRLKDIMIEVK